VRVSTGINNELKPDASLQLKKWGKKIFADFCRGDLDVSELMSSLHQIIEDDFLQVKFSFP